MDFKKIEKAAKVYEKIKELDAQIIELDKFALLVANGSVKLKVELSAEATIDETAKVGFDSDGSLIHGTNSSCGGFDSGSYLSMLLGSMDRFTKKPTPENKLIQEITETGMLQILGVILADKNDKREKYIKQLQKLTA